MQKTNVLSIFITIITACLLLTICFTDKAYSKVTIMEQHLSEAQINKIIEKSYKERKPLIAMFYVDWCGYCTKAMPHFNTIKKQYEGRVNFIKIHAERHKALADKFGVKGYPSLFVIYSPRRHKKLNWDLLLNPAQFAKEIDKILK